MTIAEALSLMELGRPFTAAELKTAYHHALMVWHPDRFQGNDELLKKAQSRTQNINEAFDLLSPLAAGERYTKSSARTEGDPAESESRLKSNPRSGSSLMKPQAATSLTRARGGRGEPFDRASWIILGIVTLAAAVGVALFSFREGSTSGSVSAKAFGGEQATKNAAQREMQAKTAQGDASQLFERGWKYERGEGVPQDKSAAAKWYRKAADQGQVRAQNNLGHLYYVGQGVPKDEAEAVKWWRKAADQGDAKAQTSIGVAYANGEGVPKDPVEAVEWYLRAAVQNCVIAQYRLGMMYANGEIPRASHRVEKPDGTIEIVGLPGPDYVQAHIWLNLAGANGSEDARKAIPGVEKKMQTNDRALAVSKAKEMFELLKEIEKK